MAKAPWTGWEDDQIRRLYPGGGPRALLPVLPLRTKAAVVRRAFCLRVACQSVYNAKAARKPSRLSTKQVAACRLFNRWRCAAPGGPSALSPVLGVRVAKVRLTARPVRSEGVSGG